MGCGSGIERSLQGLLIRTQFVLGLIEMVEELGHLPTAARKGSHGVRVFNFDLRVVAPITPLE